MGAEPGSSGRFMVRIEGDETAQVDTYFPLSAWEAVRSDAIFTPEDAELDFSLVAADGKFYFQDKTGGEIDETIRVDENGYHTLQIRNNSPVSSYSCWVCVLLDFREVNCNEKCFKKIYMHFCDNSPLFSNVCTCICNV